MKNLQLKYEVLDLVEQGLTYAEISDRLFMSKTRAWTYHKDAVHHRLLTAGTPGSEYSDINRYALKVQQKNGSGPDHDCSKGVPIAIPPEVIVHAPVAYTPREGYRGTKQAYGLLYKVNEEKAPGFSTIISSPSEIEALRFLIILMGGVRSGLGDIVFVSSRCIAIKTHIDKGRDPQYPRFVHATDLDSVSHALASCKEPCVFIDHPDRMGIEPPEYLSLLNSINNKSVFTTVALEFNNDYHKDSTILVGSENAVWTTPRGINYLFDSTCPASLFQWLPENFLPGYWDNQSSGQ